MMRRRQHVAQRGPYGRPGVLHRPNAPGRGPVDRGRQHSRRLLSVRGAPDVRAFRSSRAGRRRRELRRRGARRRRDVHRHRPGGEQRSHRRRDRRESCVQRRVRRTTLQSEHASLRRPRRRLDTGRGRSRHQHEPDAGADADTRPDQRRDGNGGAVIVDARRLGIDDRRSDSDADVDLRVRQRHRRGRRGVRQERDRQQRVLRGRLHVRGFLRRRGRNAVVQSELYAELQQVHRGRLLVLTGPRRRGEPSPLVRVVRLSVYARAGDPSVVIWRYSLKSS